MADVSIGPRPGAARLIRVAEATVAVARTEGETDVARPAPTTTITDESAGDETNNPRWRRQSPPTMVCNSPYEHRGSWEGESPPVSERLCTHLRSTSDPPR